MICWDGLFIPARVTTSVISRPLEPKNLSNLSKSKLVSGRLNLTTLALDTRPSSRPVGILTFGPPTYTNYKNHHTSTYDKQPWSLQTKILKTFVNTPVTTLTWIIMMIHFWDKSVYTHLPNSILNLEVPTWFILKYAFTSIHLVLWLSALEIKVQRMPPIQLV